MTRQTFILTLLITLISSVIFGQDNQQVKIRVAKGYVDTDGRLYQDRIYVDQLEFDLTTKTTYKRKNEAKKFKLATEIPFPKLLDDPTTINALRSADDIYKTSPCKQPTKNYFYKVDIIYCDKYPTIIKTFEISYHPYSDNDKQDKNILENIVAMYLDLIMKKK